MYALNMERDEVQCTDCHHWCRPQDVAEVCVFCERFSAENEAYELLRGEAGRLGEEGRELLRAALQLRDDLARLVQLARLGPV